MQSNKTCAQCGMTVDMNFCPQCGQSFPTKRLTLHNIFHEAYHFFTHLEKGFPVTLLALIKKPGTMQLQYIEGQRKNYQKPFSMFFLSATLTALLFYWINNFLNSHLHVGETNEIRFFHQYMVITQVVLLPTYALIAFLIFYNSGFNYAEVLVQQLYTFSILLIGVGILQLLKFIWPELESRYIELPLILIYCISTSIHFFKGKKWIIGIKAIVSTILSFGLAAFVQDFLVKHL